MFIDIIEQLNMAIADGTYYILYIVSLLLIVKLEDENGKEYIVKPMVLLSIIVFNPLVALVLDKCLQSSYWRVIWMLQEYIVISYAIILVLRKYKSFQKLMVGCVLAIIILFAGKNMFIDNYYKKAENIYRIPNEIIEICDIINNNEDNPYVATVYHVYIWIKQYDPSIDLAYGKNGGPMEIRALVEAAERDYEYLHTILVEKKWQSWYNFHWVGLYWKTQNMAKEKEQDNELYDLYSVTG